jgi:hypothetical protein
LGDHPNVLSYEIYNEMNLSLWWDGSIEQYMETLKQAAQAVHAADPNAQIILGGLSEPDARWLRPLMQAGYARYYDILAFHSYAETWTDANAVVEKYLGVEYQNQFLADQQQYGEGEPVWVNEMGYATTPERTEEQQANWFARAISTFLARPEIEQIGLYEIKDLDPGVEAIGDAKNYYLGLTYKDRTKKLAFHTVDLITDLLDTGTLTIADTQVQVLAGNQEATKYLFYHLFIRPDGAQVLFVWDRVRDSSITLQLQTPGSSAEYFSLAGEAAPYPAFDGSTLKDIQLTAGSVQIFRINP